ncbi:MAG: hypothetical protein P8Q25_02330 [Porticoccaceae bacterium]|nr:hypothetical protein [Porticoccaceae bacterium]
MTIDSSSTHMRHTSRVSATDILIDVRHPADAEQKPLSIPDIQILNIPFFNLEQQLGALDKTCSYLLYCEKGIMSRLQAQLMRDKGFEQVAVYNQIT